MIPPRSRPAERLRRLVRVSRLVRSCIAPFPAGQPSLAEVVPTMPPGELQDAQIERAQRRDDETDLPMRLAHNQRDTDLDQCCRGAHGRRYGDARNDESADPRQSGAGKGPGKSRRARSDDGVLLHRHISMTKCSKDRQRTIVTARKEGRGEGKRQQHLFDFSEWTNVPRIAPVARIRSGACTAGSSGSSE